MSVEAYVAVLEAEINDPSLKSVLLGMANHAGPDGSHCFPSVKRLMAYTALSEATIRRRFSDARTMGLIEIVKRARAQRPTEYWMDITSLREMKSPVLIEMDAKTARYRGNAKGTPHPSHSDTPGLSQGEVTPITLSPEPSYKPSDKPSIKNTLRKFAEDTFTAETGISPPQKKSEAGARWWVPLRQICEMADWLEDRIALLIRAGIKYQDQNDLSYDAPQSILKAVRYLISQEHRKKIDIESYVGGISGPPQIGKFLDDIA